MTTPLPRLPLVVGVLARLVLLPFAEPFYGDAPIRIMTAWRIGESSSYGWSWNTVAQFGPFPLNSAALLVAAGLPRMWSPALLSCLAGVLAIVFALRLASRITDDAGAISTAGLLVALDPLGLAASTTFVSEAIFLCAALALADALLSGNRLQFALSAFVASTTRYDVWLALPVAVAGWTWLHGRNLRAFVEGGLLLAPGPASILVANALAVGEPLRPLTYIESEHVRLGALLSDRFGPLSGRVRGVVFWIVVPIVALGPVAFAWIVAGLGGALRDVRRLAVLGLGWLAPVLYVLRSIVSNGFFPMARLALFPVSLLSSVVPVPSAWRVRSIVALVCLDLALVFATLSGGGAAQFFSSTTPLSRWPDDVRIARDRFAAAWETTTVVPEGDYEELAILCGAGITEGWWYADTDPAKWRAHVIVKTGSPSDRLLESTGARLEWSAGRFRGWAR